MSESIGLLMVFLLLIGGVRLMLHRSHHTARDRAVGSLNRINAGVAHRGEWLASRDTIQRIQADYLAAQHWVLETQLSSYTLYQRELPHYFSGELLAEQSRIIDIQMRRRSPRLVGALRAHHQLQVRRFSDNGLSCCLLDYQTERRMATYDYWSKRRLHTQNLGDGVYVYLMIYDLAADRWKPARLIQQLPTGWDGTSSSGHSNGQHGTGSGTYAHVTIRLTDDLPSSAGRDL
jgi:hypothetical protein